MPNLNMLLFSGGQSSRNMPYYHYTYPWLKDFLFRFLSPNPRILLISWAVWGEHTPDMMFSYAQTHWGQFGLKLIPFHREKNFLKSIQQAEAIIVSGGSIHMLVSQLEKHQLLTPLREKIESGALYIGTSSGSVIAGPTMHTSIEPPLIHIPSHKTLGILPFQLNAHYYEVGSHQFHHGPTPESRIKNYLLLNPHPHPVVCMRDGSFLHIHNNDITVRGINPVTIFGINLSKTEYPPLSNLNFLLNKKHPLYQK